MIGAVPKAFQEGEGNRANNELMLPMRRLRRTLQHEKEAQFSALYFEPRRLSERRSEQRTSVINAASGTHFRVQQLFCSHLPFPEGKNDFGIPRAGREGRSYYELAWPLLGNRIEMDRIIRAEQLSAYSGEGTPTVIHAAGGPDIMGWNLRAIAGARNLPFVATFPSELVARFREDIRTAAEIIHEDADLFLSNMLAVGNGTRDKPDGLLIKHFPLLRLNSDLLESMQQIIEDALLIVRNVSKEHDPQTVRWGKIQLWILRRIAQWMGAHNAWIKGLLEDVEAGMRIKKNVDKLLAGKSLLNSMKLSEERNFSSQGSQIADMSYAIKRQVGETVRDLFVKTADGLLLKYFEHFFTGCDMIISHGGLEDGSFLTNALKLPAEKIRYIDPKANDLISKYASVHSEALRRTSQRIEVPRVENLHTLTFRDASKLPPGVPRLKSCVFISDHHHGVGDPIDRADALTQLFHGMEKLGITFLRHVGDISDLSGNPESCAKQLAITNRIRSQCIANLPENTISETIDFPVSIVGLKGLNKKEREDRLRVILLQLRKTSLRLNLNILVRMGKNKKELVPLEILLKRNNLLPTESENWWTKEKMTINEMAVVGNHDEGTKIAEALPGCTVAESMMQYDPETGCVIVHGHIFGLPEYTKALREAGSVTELAEALKEKNVAASLESAAMIHDAATGGYLMTEKLAHINIRQWWKHKLQPTISQTVQFHRSLKNGNRKQVEHEEGHDQDTMDRFWQGLISPADEEQSAAQLAIAIHSKETPCWLAVYGHSHIPSVKKVRARSEKTGRWYWKVVANTGMFHGKPMTKVIAGNYEVTLLTWSTKDKDWRKSHHLELTDEEILQVLSTEGESDDEKTGTPEEEETLTLEEGTILVGMAAQGGHGPRQTMMHPYYLQEGKPLQYIVSGDKSDTIQLPEGAKIAHRTGLVLRYKPDGSLDLQATVFENHQRMHSLYKEALILAEQIPHCSKVISDFDPTVTLAYKIAMDRAIRESRAESMPELVQLSHHAGLTSKSKIPRSNGNTPFPIAVFGQHFIDTICGTGRPIGTHFMEYDKHILPPFIPEDIREKTAEFSSNHIVVYTRMKVAEVLKIIEEVNIPGLKWHVYSSQVTQEEDVGNVILRSTKNRKQFVESLLKGKGVWTGAGFMLPAEVLHLGLNLVISPEHGQYEQEELNAGALAEIDRVTVIRNPKDTIEALRNTFTAALLLNAPIDRKGIDLAARRKMNVPKMAYNMIFHPAADAVKPRRSK